MKQKNRNEYIRKWRSENQEKVQLANAKYYLGRKLDLEKKGISTKYMHGDPRKYGSYYKPRPTERTDRKPDRRKPAVQWNPLRCISDEEFIYNKWILIRCKSTGTFPERLLIDPEKIKAKVKKQLL